jgi:hypothetical protein
VSGFVLPEGAAVILYLQNPKEKIWGLMVSLQTAGIIVRGLDLVAFEDWLRQEARGEELSIGPSTIFYPMHRVVRMERDETIGPVLSFADRFLREVGRPVEEVLLLGR